MARPRSEAKRSSILAAACHVVAERGPISATTAEIARRALVAEGTLFTYFATKEILLDELRQQIAREIESALAEGFPERKKLRARFKFAWRRFMHWGEANPLQRAAMSNLRQVKPPAEGVIGPESMPFVKISSLIGEAQEKGALRNFTAPAMVYQMFVQIADLTLTFSSTDAQQARKVQAAGFRTFWKGNFRRGKPSEK